MAGLFDNQADVYLDARPKYPREWYSMLSALTPHHSLAWDVGTGNGQAAIGVAEFYNQVIATDVSEEQLKRAIPHPKVRYLHTPPSLSEDELMYTLGVDEGSVDLITVAVAVHWFDLPSFYSLATHLLRKPGGVIAVWTYNDFTVANAPNFEPLMRRFMETASPYWHPNVNRALDGYKKLSFPFKSVGIGREGEPLALEMQKDVSFEGFIKILRSWSAVNTAKEQGVDLLNEGVVKDFESAWGGANVIRKLTYKTFMLAGTAAV